MPIAELRAAADLPALVGRHTSTELQAVRYDSTYRGVCPLHAGASNPTSFHVFQGDGGWMAKCYACGFVGDAFAFLAARWGCTYGEAVRRWKEDEGRHDYAPAPMRPAPIKPQVLPPRQALAARYHEQLHRRTSLGITAWDWWKGQGLGPQTIERFNLGYAPECPTAPDTDSFTIPVGYRDRLMNIRHRLARPPVKRTPLGPKDTGKYRAQRAGLGAQLFNADSLDVSGGDDVLIVGGEKKVMVLCDRGVEQALMPVVCSTGGEASWRRGFDSALVSEWYDMLADFRRVFVLFDNEPAMRPVAEATARVFGRRGYTAWVPGKVDDYIIARPETGLAGLIQALANARPVLAGVYR